MLRQSFEGLYSYLARYASNGQQDIAMRLLAWMMRKAKMSRHTSHGGPQAGPPAQTIRGSSVSAHGVIAAPGAGFSPRGTPSAAGFAAASGPHNCGPTRPVQRGVVVRDSRASQGGGTTVEKFKAPKERKIEDRPAPPGVLRISPKAWAKMHWFRDRGSTEIGGFGISKRAEPTYVVDFVTIRQKCTSVTVEFDDEDVNKFLNKMVEAGWHPAEVLRIWLHTHPGNSADPSGTDRSTFEDTFGGSDWSIMVIIAKGGETHCRVRFNNGPGGESELEVKLDLHPPFDGISPEDYAAWEDEYRRNILVHSGSVTYYGHHRLHGFGEDPEWERAWSGHNDGRSGFCTGGSESARSESSADIRSSSSEIGTQDHFRLCDQTYVPPLGGMHRPVAGEIDKKWQLNEGVVEQVWQVDKNDDGTCTVVTEFGWYKFPPSARITGETGDDIESICDVSDEPPIQRGEVSWRKNQGVWVPYKLTQFFGDKIVDLREHKALILDEKKLAEQEKSQPGFAKPTGDEKKDESNKDEPTGPLTQSAIAGERLQELASNEPAPTGEPDKAKQEATPDEKAKTQVVAATEVAAAIRDSDMSRVRVDSRKDSNEPGFASPSGGP